MDFDHLHDGLRGVAVGLLTPFHDDLSVNYDAIEANAARLYDAGVRTFLAAANISEYHSLTQDERIGSVQAAVDAVGDDAVVLGGVGGSTGAARDLVAAYADAGVHGMMVMPPDHTYTHEQGLLRYFEKLADASDVPLVPYVRGFEPSADFLVELTHLDAVGGLKWALDDIPLFREAYTRGAEDVVWAEGMAEPFAPAYYLEGVEGFSAGVSNFRPELGLELFDALEAGDFERARQLRDASLAYQSFRDGRGENNVFDAAISVPAVKKGLDLAGFEGFENGAVREPIVPLTEADEARAEALYADLDAALADLL